MKKRLFRLGALCCVAAMTITTGAQALSVEEAYDILQRSYVDKLPRAAQDAKSLDELFSYTDDYTYYMTAEEYQAFLQGVEGDVSFAGIGAEITYVPEGIRIVSVLKGGGAEKAGLAAGDIIIAIESESCAPGGRGAPRQAPRRSGDERDRHRPPRGRHAGGLYRYARARHADEYDRLGHGRRGLHRLRQLRHADGDVFSRGRARE